MFYLLSQIFPFLVTESPEQFTKEGLEKTWRLIGFFVSTLAVGMIGYYVYFCPFLNQPAADTRVFGLEQSEKTREHWLKDVRDGDQRQRLQNILAGQVKGLRPADFYSFGFSSVQEASIRTPNGTTLSAILLKRPKAHRTIFVVPSSPANKCLPALTGQLSLMHKANCNVFLFDYSGIGQSTGKPTLSQALVDGQAAYHFLVKELHIPAQSIVLYAHDQLACFIASKIAITNPCAKVLFEGAIHRKATELTMHLPWMKFLPDSYFGDYALNIEPFLAGKHPPLMIATDERVGIKEGIPFFARGAFDYASEPKTFQTYSGLGNSWLVDLNRSASYNQKFEEFLASN